MIPSAAEVVSGYSRFVAKRYKWPDVFDIEEIHAAILHARDLAVEERDEPAAIFFAFASRPRAFPYGWRTMAHVLATARMHGLGLRIEVDSGGFDSLCRKVEAAALSYVELRQWFAENMKPSG